MQTFFSLTRITALLANVIDYTETLGVEIDIVKFITFQFALRLVNVNQ
jgi:hypothetical protein